MFLGLYEQDTRFGDSTEKAYSYQFDLYDNLGELVLTSGEQLHDVTQDTLSDTSTDLWHIYQDLPEGEIYKLKYTVTTLNGLTVSTIDYRVMKTVSVDPEFDIQIHADPNYDNGYIDIYLTGNTVEKGTSFIYQQVPNDAVYDENNVYYFQNTDKSYEEWTEGNTNDWAFHRLNGRIFVKEFTTIIGEAVCSGNFLITRASEVDNFFEWIEITRFTMTSQFPSHYHFQDFTVEQGVKYKYALQQYNIHDIYSNKVYLEGDKDVTVTADFEDMFLSDGVRKLKVRFNPKVTSFKNSIPEQKVETIGSKYPFIFRNGSVNYKEFPIGGLISFQMDDAMLFLNQEELQQAGILDYDYFRTNTGADNYNHIDGFQTNKYQIVKRRYEIYSQLPNQTNIVIGYREPYVEIKNIVYKDRSRIYDNVGNGLVTGDTTSKTPKGIRLDRNLTSENMRGERYFKLKVLDWLTDGKVKLFRSPAEGNYLVRLLNVQMTPQDPLGRMLHQFTCTGYEVNELKYDNLVSFGIVSPEVATNYESQWSSVDINEVINNLVGASLPVTDENGNIIKDTNGFILVSPVGAIINSISIQDFAPGDQILLKYDSGPNGLFTVGVTGSLELNNDDRTIIEVWVKPNPAVSPYDDFSRSFVYETTSIQLTEFDAIMSYNTYTQVAEQFIGPKANLLEPFNLRDNVYGPRNEYGVVINPYDEITAYQNVYNDLKAHQRFTYMLNDDTEKFVGYKVDILQVHRKEVIPIYCYTDFEFRYLGNNNWSSQNKFGATPFGIPYVNSTSLKDFYNTDTLWFDYVDEVVTKNETTGLMQAIGVNIEDIATVLTETGVSYNLYDLLELYYYDNDKKEWRPQKELCFTTLTTDSSWSQESQYYIKNNDSYEYFDVQQYLNEKTETERNTLAAAKNHLADLIASGEDIDLTEVQTAVNNAEQVLAQKQSQSWNNLINDITLYVYYPIAPGYYDLYRHQYLEGNIKYDPTFSINQKEKFNKETDKGQTIHDHTLTGDNNISVAEINDITLYNLGEVDHIRLGNGVVAEITAQIRVIDYEIEDTDLTVKTLKEEYLDTKDKINTLLDLAMLHAGELAQAEEEAKQLKQQIADIENQLGIQSSSTSSTEGVMKLALSRMIKQKKKLWDNLEAQFKSVLDILKEQKIIIDLDSTLGDALTNYIVNEDRVEDQFEDKTLEENNYLYLYADPQRYEVKEIQENGEILSRYYQIIDDTYIFYAKQYENIKEAAQEDIENCNTQLNNYEVQRGTIVGGYLEDYNEDNLPPENTLVYAQYYIAQLDKELEAAEQRLIEVKGNLVSKLLQSVLKAHQLDLTDYTDTYIQDNAEALVNLLDSYIEIRQGDLNTLTERYNQKVAKIIHYGDSVDSNSTVFNDNTNINNFSTESAEYKDTVRLLESTLPNITRIMTGTSTTAQADDEDVTFENAQGVIKLKMFLEAILTDEQAKKKKNQKQEVIEALKSWIEYLITDKQSYTYTDPTESHIYNTIYYLDHTNAELIDEYNSRDTQKIDDIKAIIEEYLDTVKKSAALGDSYNTKQKILDAYNVALGAYNNAITFSPEAALISQLILQKYYQEPPVSTDDKGFTVFETPAPDYNTTILTQLKEYHPLINAYYTTYQLYATELNTEIGNLTAQRIFLQGIVEDPGYIERAYSGIHTEEDYTNFVNRVNEIRDIYLDGDSTQVNMRGVINIINTDLQQVEKSIYDFTNLTADSTQDEKVTVLLQLLIDEYNKNQANSVTNYLNKYLDNAANSNTEVEEDLNKIIISIQNADAAYQHKVSSLKSQRDIFVQQETSYETQINDLAKLIDMVQDSRNAAQARYDEAERELQKGAELQQYQDSEALIRRIAANETHQNNIALAKQYISWLSNTQSGILNQIGQVYSNIENTEDYAKLLLQYINAYELEAFEFLHPYTALVEDLENGFYGNEGINWLYHKPESYYLSSYADKLFLKDDILNDDGTVKNNDDLINRLHSVSASVRTSAYKELETYLKTLLLLPANEMHIESEEYINSNEITFSILKVLGDRLNLPDRYCLVKLKSNGDINYPDAYNLKDDITDETKKIPLDGGRYLIPDSLTYSQNDTWWRYPEKALNDEGQPYKDSNNNDVYIIDPHAYEFYSYQSTIATREKVFQVTTRPITMQTQLSFNAIATEAANKGTPIKWLPDAPPIQFTVLLNTNLYGEFNYEFAYDIIEPKLGLLSNNELFKIEPNYYTYFNKALGLIVHDYQNGEEQGSLIGLQELDKSLWNILNSYFLAFVKYLETNATESDMAEYNALLRNLQDAKEQLAYWQNIRTQCETVLAAYNAQGVTDDSREKQQLKILIQDAKDNIKEINKRIAFYEAQKDIALTENANLRELLIQDKIIKDSRKDLEDVDKKFKDNYALYEKKVKHYLYLLFNQNPFDNNAIITSVLQHEELLHIVENAVTDTYNFGLAYAIEALKNVTNSTNQNIDFSGITDNIDTLHNILYKNYQLIYPYERPHLVDWSVDTFDINNWYYQYNQEKQEYKQLSTISSANYSTYSNIYVIENHIHHMNKTFVKDNGNFILYDYDTKDLWIKDIANLDVYYTDYPSLIDFAEQATYSPVYTDTDRFNINTQYYLLVDGEYKPISLAASDWQNYPILYTSDGNGGLMGFLNAITNGSAYINDIINAYVGTLNLYLSLLAQKLGDNTTEQNLKDALKKAQNRLEELNEILKYKVNDNIDVDQLIEDTYSALTNYLVALTLCYIDQVERRYDVV